MTLREWQGLKTQAGFLVAYFGKTDCAVCRALEPKIEELRTHLAPRVPFVKVDCESSPEVAAQEAVFTVPAVLVFCEGREILRKVRSFSVSRMAEEILDVLRGCPDYRSELP